MTIFSRLSGKMGGNRSLLLLCAYIAWPGTISQSLVNLFPYSVVGAGGTDPPNLELGLAAAAIRGYYQLRTGLQSVRL